MNILLSIVTINFNNVSGLNETFNSIFSQEYKDFEYIVIDGGSTDGSEQLIKTNKGKISYAVSESDNGIYHAMNKGISVAKGEYILFINSGDRLYSKETLKELINYLNTYDFIYGDLILENSKNEQILKKYPSNLIPTYFFYESLPHPATFIRKELFKNNLYDEKLKIVSDWKFFLQNIIQSKASYRHINQVVSVFNLAGVSSSSENEKLIAFEKQGVINEFLPKLYFLWVNRKSWVIPKIKFWIVKSRNFKGYIN